MILFFFSSPPTILSTASKKSCLLTDFLFFLAAISAASLQTFAISAPENPGVCFDKNSTSKFAPFFKGLKWTLKIAFLSLTSGRSTNICLSNLPALINALSNTSALFVAAITITFVLVPKPSISVNS